LVLVGDALAVSAAGGVATYLETCNRTHQQGTPEVTFQDWVEQNEAANTNISDLTHPLAQAH
jgi:hypothetical protein